MTPQCHELTIKPRPPKRKDAVRAVDARCVGWEDTARQVAAQVVYRLCALRSQKQFRWNEQHVTKAAAAEPGDEGVELVIERNLKKRHRDHEDEDGAQDGG